MDERNENEKMDEIMLPGFRFHPTDEELVGFYLKRKIQQRPLSIELIKQLDIYKYDPWDLPKLATTGEKEWYFYCPRDRKYRNSARPNRVTGAGFWKATGTDRPICSSEGSKCIGLKKSLVFYKGRAAKGMKTDWMMHEFRLPSIHDTGSLKRYFDKDNIPANDAWAICRIFKKANSSAQRALSHSWVSPLPETSTITTTTSDFQTQHFYESSFFSSNHNMPLESKNSATSVIQFGDSSDVQQSSMASFSLLDASPYKPIINQMNNNSAPSQLSNTDKCEIPTTSSFPAILPTSEEPSTACAIDASSLLLNMPASIFGDFDKVSRDQYFHSFNHAEQQEEAVRAILGHDPNNAGQRDQQYWGTMQPVGLGYPFSLPLMNMAGADAWKSNFFRDSSPCPSIDMSTSFSTNKCYT